MLLLRFVGVFTQQTHDIVIMSFLCRCQFVFVVMLPLWTGLNRKDNVYYNVTILWHSELTRFLLTYSKRLTRRQPSIEWRTFNSDLELQNLMNQITTPKKSKPAWSKPAQVPWSLFHDRPRGWRKIEPGKETFLDSWRSGVYDRVDVLQLPIFLKKKKIWSSGLFA